MTPFLPVVALVFLGTIIAFLGLFAAGSLAVISVGLAAIFGAGLLQVLGTRRAE